MRRTIRIAAAVAGASVLSALGMSSAALTAPPPELDAPTLRSHVPASLKYSKPTRPPKVSGFTPSSGVAGIEVTIKGANLSQPTAVTFNGVAASTVSPVSARKIKATVPPGATTGKIAVSTIAGTGESDRNFKVPLAITGFSPQSGVVGDTVTITGTGFLEVTGVKFGEATASPAIESDSQLTVTVPSGATDGPIVVSNGAASAPSAASFDVIAVPISSARIVFVTQRWGFTDQIAVMNADGTGVTQLTTDAVPSVHPSWSPDGTKIVFSRGGDLWDMNADGSQQTRLTQTAVWEDEPAVSPDGTKIVFVGNPTGYRDIWVINADGSGAVSLTNDTADDATPSWSPDGTRIAFGSNRASGARDIFVMHTDGSGVVNVTGALSTGAEYTPDWSPDGTKIAFARITSANFFLATVNSDGSGFAELMDSSGPVSGFDPSWSKCSRIVFTREGVAGGGTEIFATMNDGSEATNLTQNPEGDYSPACWGPG